MQQLIHSSAIVDDGAILGAGTRVWHFAHVCAGARIGAGCSLGQNVFVGNDVQVGDRVKIQNNVSVYDAVTIEDDVFCGPSMVFTNVYNPRAAVVRKDEYRRTVVRRGATVVNRDVPAFALMAGVPARQAGWMSRYGERLPLPLRGAGQASCPHTGDVYLLERGECLCMRLPAVSSQP
jgi:UDP-2-acetamido-3-amino-2,3-dideoxy-glucuronate N-acetyltransferase